LGIDIAFFSIDVHHRFAFARIQFYAVIDIPLAVIDHNILNGFLAAQHRGQHDTIVIAVRFGAEHSNVVFIRRGG